MTRPNLSRPRKYEVSLPSCEPWAPLSAAGPQPPGLNAASKRHSLDHAPCKAREKIRFVMLAGARSSFIRAKRRGALDLRGVAFGIAALRSAARARTVETLHGKLTGDVWSSSRSLPAVLAAARVDCSRSYRVSFFLTPQRASTDQQRMKLLKNWPVWWPTLPCRAAISARGVPPYRRFAVQRAAQDGPAGPCDRARV